MNHMCRLLRLWRTQPVDPAARKAVVEAERALRATQERWSDVTAVTEAAREQIRQNHFAEAVEKALSERKRQ